MAPLLPGERPQLPGQEVGHVADIEEELRSSDPVNGKCIQFPWTERHEDPEEEFYSLFYVQCHKLRYSVDIRPGSFSPQN